MSIPKAKFKLMQKVNVDSSSNPGLNGEHIIRDRQYITARCLGEYTGWAYRIETGEWGQEKAFSAIS